MTNERRVPGGGLADCLHYAYHGLSWENLRSAQPGVDQICAGFSVEAGSSRRSDHSHSKTIHCQQAFMPGPGLMFAE